MDEVADQKIFFATSVEVLNPNNLYNISKQ